MTENKECEYCGESVDELNEYGECRGCAEHDGTPVKTSDGWEAH